MGIPVTLERSRSGDGAHTWTFFFRTGVRRRGTPPRSVTLLSATPWRSGPSSIFQATTGSSRRRISFPGDLRESHCASAARRMPTTRHHGIPRSSRPGAPPRPVGILGVGSSDVAWGGRSDGEHAGSRPGWARMKRIIGTDVHRVQKATGSNSGYLGRHAGGRSDRSSAIAPGGTESTWHRFPTRSTTRRNDSGSRPGAPPAFCAATARRSTPSIFHRGIEEQAQRMVADAGSRLEIGDACGSPRSIEVSSRGRPHGSSGEGTGGACSTTSASSWLRRVRARR